MLAVKTSRALTFRGIATASQKKALVNYPVPDRNTLPQMKYIDHPNRNINYYETGRQPFVLAPRYADKDAALNELRERAQGDWSSLSVKDQHKLYHGHFRCAYHKYLLGDDHWKLYPIIWGFALLWATCMYQLYMGMFQLEHPEFYNDEHWINEQHKMNLQNNVWPLSGIAANYDYVEGKYRERHWFDRLFGLNGQLQWFPADPKDGKQIGFTYLNKN